MQKKKQILLVVNPISANKDKAEIVNKVISAAKDLGKEVFVYKTNGENDKEEILKLLKEKSWERVVVASGDGSIKLIAEALITRNIPIGIIPAGSANGLAFNLEIPMNPIEAIDVALGNKFSLLDSVVIENELCLHMSDLGLNAELIKNYETSNLRGKIGYLLQSVPTLFQSNHPYEFKIEAEGEVYKRQGVLLAIANAKKYGTGANVNPDGKIDDGKFEILIFKNLNPIEIIKTLRNEEDIDPDFLEIISAKEVRINCENSVPFQIDGEYRGERKSIKAEISEKQLKIAVPSSFKAL